MDVTPLTTAVTPSEAGSKLVRMEFPVWVQRSIPAARHTKRPNLPPPGSRRRCGPQAV